MFERAALYAGEDCAVKESRHLLDFTFRSLFAPRIVKVLAHENHAATRATESLVGCGCYDVCVFQRVFKQSGCDETCRVGHIDHEDGADFIGNLAEAGIVPFAAVCARAGDDELRLFGAGLLFHLFVVYTACFLVNSVADGLEHEAGKVHRTSVAEVSAVAEVHAHEFVSSLEASHEYGHVCLCTAMRLHVDPFCAEEFFCTFTCEVLDIVYHLASAIVTVGRIAFCVFVC